MRWLRRSLRGGTVQKPSPRPRLSIELLEVRTLLSGDPALTVALVAHSIAENAGPGATTGTVTRINMDVSQALTVQLASSNTT